MQIWSPSSLHVLNCDRSSQGADGIESFGWDWLIQVTAGQVSDQLPEAREAARKLVGELYAAYATCYLAQPESVFYHPVLESSTSELDPDDMEGTSGQGQEGQTAPIVGLETSPQKRGAFCLSKDDTIEAAWGRFCSKYLSLLDVQAILRVFGSRH
jgi:hypothetical protein